ncbi:MAG TPA: hypothetical protein VIM87_21910 [Chitinophaga sp.]|uniref:hypothetical protein n=1 Tax=Chitinophaga sp. TaxID=1869181 RepID=UPI002F95C69A
MKHIHTLFIIIILAAGCNTATNTNDQSDSTHITPAPVTKEKPSAFTGPMTGERINGPANIRSSANGAVIFSLNDYTLVNSTEGKNGWYNIGVLAELPNDAYGTDTLRKGHKIIVDGKVVGEILKDIPVSTSTNTRKTWAELTGYTYKDNLYPESIIENVLEDYLSKITDRSLKSLQPFISNFELEKDDRMPPFITYFNYENWIDDPSPLMRIQLVFEKDQLIGIVHSRNIQVPNTTNAALERDFQVAFYNDIPKETQQKFIKVFNSFMQGVD